MLVIPVTNTCAHEYRVEYWHENDNCESDNCGVAECSECGSFITDCGMEG